MFSNNRPQLPWRRVRPSRIVVALVIFLALGLGLTLLAVPAISPSTGAATADMLRSIVGPKPVAELESLSNAMRDAVYRGLSSIGVSGGRVSWANGGGGPSAVLTGPAMQGPNTRKSQVARLAPLARPAAAANVQHTNVNPAAASSDFGWQAYGPQAAGAPLLARAIVMVDPQRSYAGVALVRMDVSRLSLHVVPGFLEPAHPSGIDQRIPNVGQVSPQDYGQLVAAFNGGFKALHGHYGMMVDGTTLLPPIDGMGTIAVYRDGSVRVGAWGRGITASLDMVSFRQNCPPLIEEGQINPALTTDARGAWGFTNNSDITWRTGVGITQDHRYLIYAVGNGTNAEFLAEALQKAGAYDAMQLDINQYYAHFVTYSNEGTSQGSQPVAQPLLAQMIDVRNLYLTPYARDFFYLTAR